MLRHEITDYPAYKLEGKERAPGPILEVKKLRGYKGPKFISNWMRS